MIALKNYISFNEMLSSIDDYIYEQLDNYNDKGYSNYFKTSEDFISALETDNEIMNKIFKDPLSDETTEFIRSIYKETFEPCDFNDAPLIFNISNGNVKLKRKYKGTDLQNIYDNSNVLKHKYQIGNGSLSGTTKGNEYEYIFVKDSIEYITYLLMDESNDMQLSMSDKQKKLFDNLFKEIKIDNKELKTYIIDNKDNIDPNKIVYHTGKESTSRNKNGRIIRFENGKPNINLQNLKTSGDTIADVQYKFDDGNLINISLKDKDYQLSNLGTSDKTMNIYPIFDEDIKDFEKSNFRSFCDFIGINYKTIYDNIHNPKPNDPPLDIDKDFYKNIETLFRIAIGENYYMVNSNGHISFIPPMKDNDIMINSANVEYPSSSRKRININIKFNDSSKISGSIQLAIRSKSGSDDNYGFAQCQLVWGNVKINVN